MNDFFEMAGDTAQKLMVRIHPKCPNKDPILAPAKKGDVGYDLKAWVEQDGGIEVPSQEMINVRTGVFIKLPPVHWGDIRPRSSTFAKRKLFVMGGTIDEGYTGEISVFIWNPTPEAQTIHNGDRLAQLTIMPRVTPPIQLVGDLPETERGDSGFGSTGFGS
jgi:dUTP pyrophosphatase